LPDAEVAQLLTYVHLNSNALDKQVERLSGGELQRVLLALALEPKPELLMLDEPASGIDFVDKALYHERIAEINEERGTTVILVSHDLDLIRKYAHHVLWLEGGVVAAEGTPEEVLLADRLNCGRVGQ
jgi:zinc transport system ATP-binding protein